MNRTLIVALLTGGGVLLAVSGLIAGLLTPRSGGVVVSVPVGPATFAPAPQAAPKAAEAATEPRPTAAWVALTSSRAGIPATAVDAYARASLRLAEEQPGCHLDWTTLAGIGYVESQHGTIGGRTLDAKGFSSTPVIGPALDGGAFGLVRPDPAFVRLHGDRLYEHALGPMQFIGWAWRKWGADADGDGVANPFSIYDAAYAAARYLCADGHDLATPEGWTAAIRSYNHSEDYVKQVYDAATVYAERVR